MRRPRLKVGDWVEVRSRDEILETLDAQGQLDGMPFMPEMFAHCGRRFAVYKRAHKTCDTVFPVRSRRVARAVHLETRCDGQAHGGCEAGCLLYWKEDWLKRVDPPSVNEQALAPPPAGLVAIQPSTPGEHVVWAAASVPPFGDKPLRYVCQATRLPYATSNLSWWDIRQYFEDLASGNVSLCRIVCGLVYSVYFHLVNAGVGLGPALRWCYNRLHPLLRGSLFPRSPGTIPSGQPTPAATMNLQPGELVRIKPHKEILGTLDTNCRNRGMSWDAELVPYCDKTYQVLRRVTRIVDEKTGEMLEMKNPCIVLDGVICQARYSHHRMFCPRSIYPYWREIWLERVNTAPVPAPQSQLANSAGPRLLTVSKSVFHCVRQMPWLFSKQ